MPVSTPIFDELMKQTDPLSRAATANLMEIFSRGIWLRLVGDHTVSFKDREHFFRASAEAMRHILIDRARRRHTRRHGGATNASISKAWTRRLLPLMTKSWP